MPINTTWTYYYTRRTVYLSPYGIWFKKYDGPAMSARWHNCAATVFGPPKDVSNSDPAPGVYLKDNGSEPSYLTFCLALRSRSGSADTFTGELNWDG